MNTNTSVKINRKSSRSSSSSTTSRSCSNNNDEGQSTLTNSLRNNNSSATSCTKKIITADTSTKATRRTGRKKSLILIWLVVAAELLLDLLSSIIAFVAYIVGTTCCGERIDLGVIALAIAIPYFVLIMVELALLAASIRSTLKMNDDDEEDDSCNEEDMIEAIDVSSHNDGSSETKEMNIKSSSSTSAWFLRILSWIVILNPFFGFLVSWGLLYQSSKNEAFAVLGLEGASLLLQWVALYLDRDDRAGQSRRGCCCWTVWFHIILPIIPFLATVAAIVIYIEKGGVCYRDGTFWFDGCVVCDDGTMPLSSNRTAAKGTFYDTIISGGADLLTSAAGSGTCGAEDGQLIGSHHDSYCGNKTQYCWFPY